MLDRLARNMGLMVHNIKNPDSAKGVQKPPPHKQTVRHETEEQQPAPGVTLRRTVIEEIEMTPPED